MFGCLGIAREPTGLDQETKQLCRLFNWSRQMLCTATVDGYFRRLDPALAATLGYSGEDLQSRPLIDFVHPADREATLRELAKLADGRPTLRFENRYRCKDGSYRWLAWASIPQDEEGVLYATALDITERKRAEELFRAALESAPDAVVIVDLAGEIILVNSVAETMFGYSRTELLGQSVELLVPPAFHQHHVENRRNYCAEPSIRPMGPSRCVLARHKDGSKIPIEVTLSPVELDEGRMVFASIRDISERAWMEREIRAREIQMEAAREHRLSHSAGVLALSAEDPFEEGPPVQLEAGDLLFLVTDGVLEAHSANRSDGVFDEARTLAVVRRHLDKPSKDVVTAIHQAFRDFSENQRPFDDVTIVVVKCL